MTASKELYAVCDHFLSVESRHAAMSETKRDPKKRLVLMRHPFGYMPAPA